MRKKIMKRNIDDDLLAWAKEKNERKPLLLRGMRQVGKTTAVRRLGKHFKYFIEVNFETDAAARDLFENKKLSPQELADRLSAIYGVAVIAKKTLLFFDEIQVSLRAIISLRYFYEQYPELHVVAASSFLEFDLKELSSFGAGRIDFMYMYPMNFIEFLSARGRDNLVREIENANCKTSLIKPTHDLIIEQFRMFLILGGMPQVVHAFTSGASLGECQKILDALIGTFREDFANYRKKFPVSQISAVFDSVAAQTGKKFIFSDVSPKYAHNQLKKALNFLIISGLVIPVTQTSANALPLSSEINPKNRKMFLADTGIFQRLSGISLKDILVYNDFETINSGNIAELFAALELLKAGPSNIQKNLYYWHRESRSSNAEVDFVLESGQNVIPVEVKRNSKGSMQSMRLFLEEKKSPFGIRTSQENFSQTQDIKVIPLYAIGLAGEDK